MTNHITASPLTWPVGWERKGCGRSSPFGKVGRKLTIGRATQFILNELRLMGADDWDVIISTNLRLRGDGLPHSNQAAPDDPGAAVWWIENGEQQVLALDPFDNVAHNLYSIGKSIEALRSIDRWGGGQILKRAYTGLTALPTPEQAGGMSWRVVLNSPDCIDLKTIKHRYMTLRSYYYQDNPNADAEMFHQVQLAWEQAQREFSE